MQCGLVLNAAFVFITFFAQNVTMYLVGTLLCALQCELSLSSALMTVQARFLGVCGA